MRSCAASLLQTETNYKKDEIRKMKKLIISLLGVFLLCGCSTVIPDNASSSSGKVYDDYNMSFTEKESDSSFFFI